jgi:hypothetical protein
MASRRVVMKVRVNELAWTNSTCVLSAGRTAWGLAGSEGWLRPGVETTFVVPILPKAWSAAKRVLAAGGEADMRCNAYAVDASGKRKVEYVQIRLP